MPTEVGTQTSVIVSRVSVWLDPGPGLRRGRLCAGMTVLGDEIQLC